MTDKYIHVEYNLPDDVWMDAYFETEPGADEFTHALDDRGIEYKYQGLVELPT